MRYLNPHGEEPAKPASRTMWPLRRAAKLGGLRLLEHEIVFDHVERGRDVLSGRRAAGRLALEVDDELFLDAIYHVGLDVGVAVLEEVRHDAVKAGRIDLEVNVGGTHVRDLGALHQLADRA